MAEESHRSTMPSWAALLGMLAIAGYQNRDKLADLLRRAGAGRDVATGDEAGARIKEMADQLGGREATDVMTDAVKGVVEGLRKSSLGPVADSWIGTGPNEPITEPRFEHAVGRDLVDELSRRTGLSRSDLLRRLAADVPRLVDDLTPDGRLPG